MKWTSSTSKFIAIKDDPRFLTGHSLMMGEQRRGLCSSVAHSLAPARGRPLSTRVREPELMDDPGLDAREHARALAGLRRVNIASRTAHTLWREIRQQAPADASAPLTLLDIATGSGDVPMAIERLARREGRMISVAGCDLSANAIEVARERNGRRDAARFFVHDILRADIPDRYDVVTCCLFLHHLDPPEAVVAMRRLASAATGRVVVSDLDRSRAGYALAWLGSRLGSRSPVVRTDALLSVRAAFTMDEARALADEAGLAGAVVRPCWPCRWLLTWSRP